MAEDEWIDEENDAAVGFRRNFGFHERERAWGQTLDLGTFDPSGFPDLANTLAIQWIAVTNLAAEGVHDENILRQVHALHNVCRQDQPPSEDHRDPMPFDAWLVQVVQGPWSLPEALFLAKAGTEYVGMAQLWRTNEADVVENGFTGVLSAYRNRGIARALKLQAIAYAREHGYHYIRTSNHATNGPMLRVNVLLGFRKTAAKIRFEKTLTGSNLA